MVAERNTLAGGLLRFSRLHRAIKPFGIEIAFAFDDLDGPVRPDACEILSMAQAATRKWDATILPGAGFSAAFINQLNRFHSDVFGTRVQTILNDRSRKDRFLSANISFAPHSVIFNTRDWAPGTYTEFSGDRFAIVEGAVDPGFFAPPIRYVRRQNANFIIGMQAKYLNDLTAIAPLLPGHVAFHVIRMSAPNTGALSPELQALTEQGRLTFLGTVAEEDLPAFYHGCDCILHLERSAGWANLVAEAMACGVPVVCSDKGTLAIAKAGVTASVVAPDDPNMVATALIDVMDNPEEAEIRAQAARKHISGYSWAAYGGRFLEAASDDGRRHYLSAPELGFHGKWPKESRLHDIDLLLPFCAGANVLDIGCGEGLIALKLFEAGAYSVHGFDIEPGRILSARALTANWPEAEFRADTIVPWADFARRHGDLLRASYDTVLFLSVYHHLPADKRDSVLENLLTLSKDVFAIRTPERLFEVDKVHERIIRYGFTSWGLGHTAIGGSAPLRLYRRTKIRL